MAKRKTEEYIFADAYIGSFVKNLMNRQDMMRLASCKDLAAAEGILREFGYGEAKELYDNDIEWFIRREQNKLFNLIYDTLPERKELALCLFPYDYHNVKVCLKAEFLGITPDEDLLVSTGDMDWKRVVAMVRDRNYMFMPVYMKEAIIEATDLFGRGGDPQEIDIILDKACYRQMLAAAEETKEDFLIGIVKRQIDILNLKTFVRLRQIRKPWSFFQKVFLTGGNIGEQLFISCYEEPYEQMAEKLAPYGLQEPMAEGGREIKETGDFSLLEKLCDDKMMEFNKQAKYYSFGIVPIAGYWYAKEVEIDNLRIILTGILIGSTPEQIGERLREPYV
ncbi:V-type ATPase subunit [Ihubacter sp. rT4E-8]|uniref:V-type ATPase subunit n=1 Tax=Ihubacter sp. rT4E-8 TaxID=3242369 RepID=UPI003CF56FD8